MQIEPLTLYNSNLSHTANNCHVRKFKGDVKTLPHPN